MTPQRFDALTKLLTEKLSRRAALRTTGVGLAVGLTGVSTLRALAQDATPAAKSADGCAATTETDNLAIVMRWYDEALNQGKLDVIDEIVAADADHDAPVFPDSPDPEQTKKILGAILAAYPDIHFTVEQTLTKNEFVVVRWSTIGTQEAEFHGVPASNQQATWSGINIFRISCGQIVGIWSEVDSLTQLGLGPKRNAPLDATPAELASPVAGCVEGTEESNSAIASRWLDVWNAKDVTLYEELVLPDTVHHFGQGDDSVGIKALQDGAQVFFDAFPDLVLTQHEVIVDGDLVAIRYSDVGTHLGSFFGVAPTGKKMTWTGINIFRFECGVVAESWSEVSGYGIWQQLGVIPQTATPAS